MEHAFFPYQFTTRRPARPLIFILMGQCDGCVKKTESFDKKRLTSSFFRCIIANENHFHLDKNPPHRALLLPLKDRAQVPSNPNKFK